MKADLYIDANGMETLAKGQNLYPWHITARIIEDDSTQDYPAPDNCCQIASGVDLRMPGQDVCVSNAQAALNKRLQEIRASAYAEEREIQNRLNDLLLVGYNQPSVGRPDANDDIVL